MTSLQPLTFTLMQIAFAFLVLGLVSEGLRIAALRKRVEQLEFRLLLIQGTNEARMP